MEFDKVLSEQNEICLKGVIEVRVSEEVAKERVLGRNRGADDNEEVFYNRMKVYTEPLNEILDFYQKKNFILLSMESALSNLSLQTWKNWLKNSKYIRRKNEFKQNQNRRYSK